MILTHLHIYHRNISKHDALLKNYTNAPQFLNITHNHTHCLMPPKSIQKMAGRCALLNAAETELFSLSCLNK